MSSVVTKEIQNIDALLMLFAAHFHLVVYVNKQNIQ
jgi:hypothetical protein